MLSAIWLTMKSTDVAAIAPIGTSVSVETNSPIAAMPASIDVTYSVTSRVRHSAAP